MVIFGIIIYFTREDQRNIKKLKKKYYNISGLPPHIAEETLQRHIERLKEKYPDKSLEWYLDKIIFDLEKDKR
ncbi:MAG: hypothetical protein ACOC56_01165 [Atribacterota bacterium]